jgi:hypothetical protein|tara:strand:- start:594 stop:1151 length:558 start_codon:yes stop_codon:yes gene_type:complete
MAFGYQVLGFGSGVSAGEATAPEVAWLGARGVFCGGKGPGGVINVIEYITIASAGNATDFGDVVTARSGAGACSNGSRLVYGGGGNTSTYSFNQIEYLTIGSLGNMSDFGDLTDSRRQVAAAASNATIGMWLGGHDGYAAAKNTVDKVNIASTGNATDFGDLSMAKGNGSATSNGTRAVYAGGDG